MYMYITRAMCVYTDCSFFFSEMNDYELFIEYDFDITYTYMHVSIILYACILFWWATIYVVLSFS